jgi:hypothetical protein
MQIESVDFLLSTTPDVAIDETMMQRFGPLSTARCVSLLFNQQQPSNAISQTPVGLFAVSTAQAAASHIRLDALDVANAEAMAATNACDRRRQAGGLKTNLEVARCAEPQIMKAYSSAGFPYMDLVRSAVAKRIEIAEQLDERALTEAQAQTKIAQLISVFNDKMRERQRVAQ